MFIQNKDYKRSELHDEFGGNRQRGISNCVNHPIIFIFSNPNTEQQDVYMMNGETNIFIIVEKEELVT